MNRIFAVGCLAMATVLSLSACSSGTNTTNPGPGLPPPTEPPTESPTADALDCSTIRFKQSSTVDALPGGIWTGSLVDCANNLRYDGATAMVTEDGQFRIIGEFGHLLAGALQTEGDTFNGGGADFARWGLEYFSGPTTHLWVQGLVDERQALMGRWGTEWGFYGYFTFDYQEHYEQASSLADRAGVWSSYMNHLGITYDGVWTIEPDGRFSGQDNMGCLHSGQFTLIDERYNIVSVQLVVTACELAGTYAGLAVLDDEADWFAQALEISVDDGTRALRLFLVI